MTAQPSGPVHPASFAERTPSPSKESSPTDHDDATKDRPIDLSSLYRLDSFLDDMGTRTIRLGVTGLARAGKTIFIASLVHNLLRAAAPGAPLRLRGFGPVDEGRLLSAQIRHDARPTIPEFPYARALDSLLDGVEWPQPTEGLARIRLSLRYRSRQGLRGLGHRLHVLGAPERRLDLDIVDYPGEWLADLPMLGQSFAEWSRDMLALAHSPARAAAAREWLQALDGLDPHAGHDEVQAERLAEIYTRYLEASRQPPFSQRFLQPGRFLNPDALRGSPVLRFCPLPPVEGKAERDSLHAAFAKKYRTYQQEVVRPFYRQVFQRIDRQVVLIDALAMLNDGQAAFDDATRALRAILPNFRHGRRPDLLSWLTGRGIERVLFAATKADHVVRGDRAHLATLTARMLSIIDAENRIQASADQEVMALAAIRATEDYVRTDTNREILYGRRAGEAEAAPVDPGGVPLDFPPRWDRLSYRFWDFQPPAEGDQRHAGFPNIRLGDALDFLIGEEMR